jgi:hypothetical protein
MKDMRTVENRALDLSDQDIREREFLVQGALIAERRRRLAVGC